MIDKIPKEYIEPVIQGWFTTNLKVWIPLIIIFISAVTFFVTQSDRIVSLEIVNAEIITRQRETETKVSEANATWQRIDERTLQMQKDIDFIKSKVQ